MLCAAHGRPLAGCGLSLAALTAHIVMARSRRAEVRLALAALALGAGVEAVVAATGAFRYASGSMALGYVTPWALALWMQLATTLRFALGWMRGRTLAAAAFGAFGGPLAFRFGAALGGGAVERSAVLAAVWAVSMALLVRWAGPPEAGGGYRFEGG